jgi:hypothetical protein
MADAGHALTRLRRDENDSNHVMSVPLGSQRMKEDTALERTCCLIDAVLFLKKKKKCSRTENTHTKVASNSLSIKN